MATKSFFGRLQANPSLAETIVNKKKEKIVPSKVQEEKQNALLRKVHASYFYRPGAVPVDPRNGLDMRTMCPSQDPSYQDSRVWNT